MTSTTGRHDPGPQPGRRPHPAPGPGVAWVAQRTGLDVGELTGTPAAATAAVQAAAREIFVLAAALQSADPATRAAAYDEADQLRREFTAAPSPGETFRHRVAPLLRDIARKQSPPDGRPSV